MKRARIPAILCTAAATLLLAALAQAPYTPPGADEALLRFSWRLGIAAEETCRPRTDAELDALPAHMRAPEVCTRESAAYSLITRIDDAPPDTLPLIRGGLKGDRPLFVLEERALVPGRHRVRVALLRRDESGDTSTLASLDTTVSLERGSVQLVTLDAEGKHFVVRSSAPR